ncbi:hypothetical protein [Campylobacter sp. 19-13652]|uniref:hypothetical protein n=1 Tax=Campylobacter sp. 19-13652 TaxID=2840180 RepID=UPI001C79A54B|nr:hypothetical protein [Campylobacter sp. 19-13652]BCX79272.1 hypothetical protein LBC_07340 [Campylobacter sp. 19-13652]
MKSVVLVYTGDSWLSHSSLNLVGVCPDMDKAFKLLKKACRRDKGKIGFIDINASEPQGEIIYPGDEYGAFCLRSVKVSEVL